MIPQHEGLALGVNKGSLYAHCLLYTEYAQCYSLYCTVLYGTVLHCTVLHTNRLFPEGVLPLQQFLQTPRDTVVAEGHAAVLPCQVWIPIVLPPTVGSSITFLRKSEIDF